MNEFELIKKYLKPLAKKNPSSLNLTDDIYFDKQKKLAISVDTYVKGVHFVNSNPKFFVKKIFRSALSDLYSKGIKPETYFLSLGINKSHSSHKWLYEFKKILESEQKKFKVFLGGGDTIKNKNLLITIIVMGFSKSKPILRNGASINDDVYVTGNIGDSFLGLNVLKNKANFGKYNDFFRKIYIEPNLPFSITPYLNQFASSSIDISDGLIQDLNHICEESKLGAFIDLNKLPISTQCIALIKKKKIKLINMFSHGDDYQILFTSGSKNRVKIKSLSKKLKLKITKIGRITKELKIHFKYNAKYFKHNVTKMGYTHTF
jgi:thiamine-monophosphate kinase